MVRPEGSTGGFDLEVEPLSYSCRHFPLLFLLAAFFRSIAVANEARMDTKVYTPKEMSL